MPQTAAPPRYQTTPRRALLAVGVVSLTITAVYVLTILGFMANQPTPRDNPLIVVLPVSALIVEVGCLLALGLLAPVWWQLDRRGFRGWPAGVLAGAVPSSLAGAAWALATFHDIVAKGQGAGGAVGVVFFTLISATVGAALGLLAWRIAYRRVPEAPDVAGVF
ncbi:MAG: hypothetical protein JSR45_17875 [Proteobacteria bacterium]|nr:hypothetical protein [Pseudomonadota bacterium]